MSMLDDPAVRWRGRVILRADQLYARLPATAVQRAAGGLPTPRAGLRSADGALEAVPLDRWLAPTTPADDRIIGIGGWPAALLERVAALLAPGGEAIVEVDLPGTRTRSMHVRIEADRHVSDWLAWARVSADDIGAIGADAGLALVDAIGDEDEDRWFARLRACPGGGPVLPA